MQEKLEFEEQAKAAAEVRQCIIDSDAKHVKNAMCTQMPPRLLTTQHCVPGTVGSKAEQPRQGGTFQHGSVNGCEAGACEAGKESICAQAKKTCCEHKRDN